MLERDYLMRLLKSFIDVIASIANLKKERKHEQILSVVDEQLSLLLRLNSKHIHALSEDSLLQLMTTYGVLEVEKVLMAAALLKEEGEAYKQLGREAESFRSLHRSLRLFVRASMEKPDSGAIDYPTAIDELGTRLSGYRLPDDTAELLMCYYESIGQYARAEDWLYRLDWRGNAAVADIGERFYARMAQLDDDVLAAGDFSKTEAAEGLADWRGKAGGRG